MSKRMIANNEVKIADGANATCSTVTGDLCTNSNKQNIAEEQLKPLEGYAGTPGHPLAGEVSSKQQANSQVQAHDALTQTNKAPPAAEVSSVCNSTTSEPNLLMSKNKAAPPITCTTKNYIVMTAKSLAVAPVGTFQFPDKTASTSIDMRMRKVLETLHEDPHSQKVPEESNKLIKLKSPEPNMASVSIEEHAALTLLDKESIRNKLSNVYRAFYNPPRMQSGDCGYPQPQFQIVPIFSGMVSYLISRKAFPRKDPISAFKLQISRHPFECPETCCDQPIFVSDFCKHYMTNHSIIPVERIMPHQCKNFLLNVKLTRCGTPKSHMLYLLRNKIVDLGSGEFKNYLPMVLMTAWLNVLELCKVGLNEQAKFRKQEASIGEYLAIWLAGIVPENYPIRVNLAAWSRHGKETVCHRVYSGDIYSARCPQNVAKILDSGKALLISSQEVQLLTKNGKNLLEIQIGAQ